MSGATFRTLLPHLADHVTCHLIDLPGAGSSRFTADTPLTVEQHIHSVRRVLDLLELDDVAVVGHDSGGMIARHAVAGDPRLRALGLIDTEQPHGLTGGSSRSSPARHLPGFGAASAGSPGDRGCAATRSCSATRSPTAAARRRVRRVLPPAAPQTPHDATPPSGCCGASTTGTCANSPSCTPDRRPRPARLGQPGRVLPVGWAAEMVGHVPRRRARGRRGRRAVRPRGTPAEVAAALLRAVQN